MGRGLSITHTAFLTGLSLVMGLACATEARAQAAGLLRWSAPPECPDAEEIATRLYVPAGIAPGLVLEATVEPTEDGYRLTLRGTRDGQALAERTLEAPSCEPLAEAAVLLASLAMETAAREAPVPVLRTDESGEELAPPLPAIPAVPPTPPAGPPRWSLRFGAHLEAGFLPSRTVGLAAGLETRLWRRGYVALRAMLNPQESPGPYRLMLNVEDEEVRVRVRLRYGVARLEGGWAPRLGAEGRFGVRVGALVEAGVVSARAEGNRLTPAGPVREPVGAFGVVAGASWWPSGIGGRLGLAVSGDVRMAVNRVRFVVEGATDGAGATPPVARLGAVAGAALFEVRVRLGRTS
ncbi:MAG: hypothetical protein AAGH15_21220 [Myxococcota bacterium]